MEIVITFIKAKGYDRYNYGVARRCHIGDFSPYLEI